LALVNVLWKSRFSAPWVVVWALMYGGVIAYLFIAT
jgi:hypothetical protein